MASRHERESRHKRGREDEHTLRARETWQGGGEIGFRQLDPVAESGPSSASRYEPDDDHDYARRYGYYEDRHLGRSTEDRRGTYEMRAGLTSLEDMSQRERDYRDARDAREARDARGDHGHRRNWVDRILGRDRDDRHDRDDRYDRDDRHGWLQRGQDVGRIYHRDDDERIPRGFDRRPRITGEAETDWEVRGYRNAGHDGRTHQFAGYRDEDGDNMRGQFRRSADDGEMGRRGTTQPRDERGRFIDEDHRREMRDVRGMREMRYFHDEQDRDRRGSYDRPRDDRGRFIDEDEQRRHMRGERDMRGYGDHREMRGGHGEQRRDVRGLYDRHRDERSRFIDEDERRRDMRSSRDMRGPGEDRPRTSRRAFLYSPRDVDDQRDVHDWRDVHDQRDIRDTHEIRDQRDVRDDRDPRARNDDRRFGSRRNR